MLPKVIAVRSRTSVLRGRRVEGSAVDKGASDATAETAGPADGAPEEEDDEWDAVDMDERIARSNLAAGDDGSEEEEDYVARPAGELSSRLAALAASSAEAKQAAEKRKEEVRDVWRSFHMPHAA